MRVTRDLDAREDYHRNLALGFGLVLLVAGPGLVHQLPQPGALFPGRRRGARFEAVSPDLDLDPWVLGDVEVPARMRRGSPLRRDDDVAVAVLLVDQGCRALLPGLSSAGREKQRLRTSPVVSFCAVRRPVAVDMFLTEEHHGWIRTAWSVHSRRRPCRR